MAAIDFPSFLRGPIKASKNRNIQEAYRQNDPASGPPYVERLSDDNPTVFNIQFAFESGYKRAFIAWLNSPDYCDKGLNEFNIDLEIESGISTQEARFTSGGFPQLTSEAGSVFFYQAQIIVRKLNDPDEGYTDEILYLAENTNCGDVVGGAELLDYAINQDWPEV